MAENNASLAAPLVSRLSEIEAKPINWIIPHIIPAYSITILAGDGGCGKSTLCCEFIRSVTTGTPCLLSESSGNAMCGTVLVMSGEDSASRIIKPKLQALGADLTKVLALNEELLLEANKLKIGTTEFEKLIAEQRPTLCCIDPLQSFINCGVDMSSRSKIRNVMSRLLALSEQYATTFLIVCHTNKRSNAYGRSRLADSADIWDCARSVMIMGNTNDGDCKYLSNEKNNYHALQDTIILTLNENMVDIVGTCKNRDRDFVQRADLSRKAFGVDQCKNKMLTLLKENGGSCFSSLLNETLVAEGFHPNAVNQARNILKRSKLIANHPVGANADRKWVTKLYSD